MNPLCIVSVLYANVGDLFLLGRIGVVLKFLWRAEQVFFNSQLFAQPVHCLLVRFKLSIGQNVIDLLAQANQFAGDQYGSMAVERVLFCAHQGNAHALTSVQYALNSGLKQSCLDQSPELDAPILIAGWIDTPCSKFFAEIHVRYSMCP